MKKKTKDQKQKEDELDPFNTIVLCPVCLRPDLEFVHEFTAGWATTPKRYCKSCSYSGILVLEVNKEEYYNIPEEEREEVLKKWREEIFSEDEEEDEEQNSN